ncbi:transporter substrate-binding domain-containing protein [Silicimonas algicola]|uniref:Amino acid ABC transporter substrate-binding protein (PAAT family) n=1 Tax=Silicimonas algicola TaxID=1826607 RepID=A0A316G7F7_9RHOB|nr:transporter substrate-binding domain-containing protein [Silicimonas algicola]AZQ67219.1 transporter substrate-binding domain-containing protein [Silicimonas algicola]PWK56881.1 amino acid ABC transporter substrate-binding protein (PAAT family) [Silicimonas algicola]
MALPPSRQLLSEYAPEGVLRVALNHGNRILVGRDETGAPCGISVDLARLVAGTLNLPLQFVEYERAADVSGSATEGVWDLCFLAVDPKRAETLDFTLPYVAIEGRYLAGPGCDAADAAALVASGAPVGTVEGSAYTLTLERQAGADHLVRFPDIRAMLAALDVGTVAAGAGIGDVMAAEAALRPGSRVLSPPFMEIRQAMAIVKGRPRAARHLTDMLANLARSRAIADILERNGVARNAAVLPD